MTVSVHDVLVPLQAPDHCVKIQPADGVAVNVTEVPAAKAWLHVGSHAMPAGELDTAPPVPGTTTTESVGVSADVTHGPNVMVLPDAPYTTVWSSFDGTSGCGGDTAGGVGFSSAAKPYAMPMSLPPAGVVLADFTAPGGWMNIGVPLIVAVCIQ